MIIKPAKRTDSLHPYYFSIKNPQVAALSKERVAKGLDPVINMGIGAPDGMPPAEAIEELCSCARKSDSHKYQNYFGLPELRQAYSDWYRRYYHVELDPVSEIQPLVGSKEGILMICLTFLDEGDKVLMPDPGYPTYTSATALTQADVITYSLKQELGWQPDFEELEKTDLSGVKLMWVNYPNMPTGAPATHELYSKLVAFAKKHHIMVVNDNPYSFILNDEPMSILEVEGAKDCCIELNSLSKAHNMSGWRLGMVAGDEDSIREIRKVKSQMDSGMFKPLQMAAIKALAAGPEWFEALNAEYRRRKEYVWKLFDTIGAKYEKDAQGLFVWGKVTADNPYAQGGDPSKTLGERVSDKLLFEKGVFITPGFIFGHGGDDYVRASLCAPIPMIEKAIEAIK